MPTTKRIRKSSSNHSAYKLKIIDENTLDEVYSTDLSKTKIYTFLSSLFVFTAIITVLLIVFTPLRFYIPGYGSNKAQKEALILKRQLDSLGVLVKEQQAYTANIKTIINGGYKGIKDTMALDMKKVKAEDMNSIMPDADDIKKDAAATLKKESPKNGTGK